MRLTIILFVYFTLISCSSSSKDIASENIKTYLEINSNGEYTVKEIEILKFDTITDSNLLNYLYESYKSKANSCLDETKKYENETRTALKKLQVSRTTSLKEIYKNEFDEKISKMNLYNDSLIYYNEKLKILNSLTPDSINFTFYESKVKYKIIHRDKSADMGDQLFFYFDKELNIIEPTTLLKIAKQKFLDN